jgi:hypothetical protein
MRVGETFPQVIETRKVSVSHRSCSKRMPAARRTYPILACSPVRQVIFNRKETLKNAFFGGSPQ